LSRTLLAMMMLCLGLLAGAPTETSLLAQTGEWQTTSLSGAPVGRYGHTAIWTGEEMIVWGGYFHLNNFLNDGARYNPTTDTWTPMTTINAPIGRLRHTAIWTGEEMIVWGGESGGGGVTTNTGGRYDPVTDTWRSISGENAPSRREMHSAVWTGTEMIIWGGCPTIHCRQVFNDGGRYDPATDTWTPISAVEGLTPRHFHQAVWTGDRMIVWGGSDASQGASYDPETGTWSSLSETNAPVPTYQAASVWTGSEMIVWGGCKVFMPEAPCTSANQTPYVNSGGRYNPATDTWVRTTASGAPAARWAHTAVWTGQEMVVWGGCGDECYDTGGLYYPGTNSWKPMVTIGAPSPRSNHKAVWTGETMVVWGGCDRGGCGAAGYYDTGGRYTPMSATPTLTNTPAPTATPTLTPTSTPMASPTATSTQPPRWQSYMPLLANNMMGMLPAPGPTVTPTTPCHTDLLPEEGDVVWVVSGNPVSNYVGDDDIYAGIWEGAIYLGVVRFDLSDVPADAVILDARLTITGQNTTYLADQGAWAVHMLDSSLDAGWPVQGYTAVAEAPSLGPLLDLEDGDFELDAGQLRAGAPSRLALTEPLVVELNHRLGMTNLVTFRIEGPKSGDNNLCLWDFGYDVGRLLIPPMLSLVYIGNSAPSPAPPLAPTAHVP